MDGRSTSAEWDWYWLLREPERKRLLAWFTDDGVEPDQYAAAMFPGESVDRAMAEWYNAVTLSDMAAWLSRGKCPPFGVECLTTYPIWEVFGPDFDPAPYDNVTVTEYPGSPGADVCTAQEGSEAPGASWAAIVGPGEVAAMLGVKRETVRMWRVRGLLPAPGRVISNIPLWDAGVILEWARATGRLAA